jgi:precorrin-6B methylase 2
VGTRPWRLRHNMRMLGFRVTAVLPLLLTASLLAPAPSSAQEVFQPKSGQAGKDVVWVPTPPELVEKMLDMAQVTPDDLVMDLGSGDGRNIIAAAKRGARAVGVEYNPDMVELSRRMAREAGVDGKATFVEGDMYEADISKATVMALFLLPTNLSKLQDKFLALRPGSRIVLNTFGIEGWEADATEAIPECTSWCTAYLLVVPAQVAGTWRFPNGRFTLTQKYQILSGELTGRDNTATTISKGRMSGDQIRLTVGDTEYAGRVLGDRIEGTMTNGTRQQKWTATRERP